MIIHKINIFHCPNFLHKSICLHIFAEILNIRTIMEAIETMITRRSVRGFVPDKMPEQTVIDRVAEAGTYAPSGMGRQSAAIVVVQDRATRDLLSRLNAQIMDSTGDPFYGAPTVLVVFADSRRPTYVEDGSLVICCGGGGIPVIQQGCHLSGAVAVLDKDLAASLLADSLAADILLILTTVEKASLHYRQPNEQFLNQLTVSEAETYAEAGHFAPGSMLPKIQAACSFVRNHPERRAIITLLDKAADALAGRTGTMIKA